jgi:hypothetical protein
MPAAPKEHLTTVGGLALLAAFVCFVAAVIFACLTTVRLNPGGSGSTDAPNITAAGAACGFAVATGLCLVAAAIAESGAKRRETKPTTPATSEPLPGGPV